MLYEGAGRVVLFCVCCLLCFQVSKPRGLPDLALLPYPPTPHFRPPGPMLPVHRTVAGAVRPGPPARAACLMAGWRIPHRPRPLSQQRMSLQHMPHNHRAPFPRPSSSTCQLDNHGKKTGGSVCHHKGTSIGWRWPDAGWRSGSG
jgi:hypothetical protein